MVSSLPNILVSGTEHFSEIGLAACTGVEGRIGVGGYTLGGGWGYKTGLHGVAVDNLIAVR
jgi:hypothetical protein